jgi:hypothetical protein
VVVIIVDAIVIVIAAIVVLLVVDINVITLYITDWPGWRRTTDEPRCVILRTDSSRDVKSDRKTA